MRERLILIGLGAAFAMVLGAASGLLTSRQMQTTGTPTSVPGTSGNGSSDSIARLDHQHGCTVAKADAAGCLAPADFSSFSAKADPAGCDAGQFLRQIGLGTYACAAPPAGPGGLEAPTCNPDAGQVAFGNGSTLSCVDYVKNAGAAGTVPAEGISGLPSCAVGSVLTTGDSGVPYCVTSVSGSAAYATSMLVAPPESGRIFSNSTLTTGTSAMVVTSDKAYFLYVGVVQTPITPKYVTFWLNTVAGAGATCEVGYFSTPSAPILGTNQVLTKIVAGDTDTIVGGAARLVKNTNAFAVSAGWDTDQRPVGTQIRGNTIRNGPTGKAQIRAWGVHETDCSHNRIETVGEISIQFGGQADDPCKGNVIAHNHHAGAIDIVTPIYAGVTLRDNCLLGAPSQRVFDVQDFGALGDGATDDGAALQAAAAALQAAGGGTLLFRRGVYRLFTVGQIYSSLMTLSGLASIKLVFEDAELQIDPARTFDATKYLFVFQGCSNVEVDGHPRCTGPAFDVTASFSVAFALLVQGCDKVEIPAISLDGWSSAIEARKLIGDPDSYRSKHIHVGELVADNCANALRLQFSGDDTVVDRLISTGTGQAIIAYGLRGLRAKVFSTNFKSGYYASEPDVQLSGGIRTSPGASEIADVEIEYTNLDSYALSSTSSPGVGLYAHGQSVNTLSRIKIVQHVRLLAQWVTAHDYVLGDRRQNGASPNQHAYVCTKAGTSDAGPSGTAISGIEDGTAEWGYTGHVMSRNTGAQDGVGRGHILRDIDISGDYDVGGGSAPYLIDVGPDWLAAGDYFRSWHIHDLTLLRDADDACIRLRVVPLADTLTMERIQLGNCLDLWGVSGNLAADGAWAGGRYYFWPANGGRVVVREVTADNLDIEAGTTHLPLRMLDASPLTASSVTTIVLGANERADGGLVVTNAREDQVVTYALPASKAGMRYRFVRQGGYAMHLDPNSSEVITGGGAGKYLSLDANGTYVDLFCGLDGVWAVATSSGTASFES